jgi:hypothetical protein
VRFNFDPQSFLYYSVSQTVVLGFCPCGPLRLNISPKRTEKNKINVNWVSHTVVENLKQFAFKGDKSWVVRRTFWLIKVVRRTFWLKKVVRRTFWLIKVVPTWKKFGKRCYIRTTNISIKISYLERISINCFYQRITSNPDWCCVSNSGIWRTERKLRLELNVSTHHTAKTTGANTHIMYPP